MKRLIQKVKELDGKSYKLLKTIQGKYDGDVFSLYMDYIQGDPFAAPSKIRVAFPFTYTNLPEELIDSASRKSAFEDFFAREVNLQIKKRAVSRMGTGKGGMIAIDAPGQEVLKRTAVKVTEKHIEIRLSIGLPANGRRIRGHDTGKLLGEIVPDITRKALTHFSKEAVKSHIELSDDQQLIRNYIKENEFICFIANGAVLPRESGVSNKPLSKAVSFQSPAAYEKTIQLSKEKTVTGFALPKGLTLIAGGGYHGKSTLLHAIERGVYNHAPGDGREYVITDQSAVKIKAEDGRSIHGVDISPFISNLPFEKDTRSFSTLDASGSTSQAASIMEALEMRSKLILMDEDTSATNFMIRDARMQKLVSEEPITPFVDYVESLFKDQDVSTVMAIGGSGDYFEASDHVIVMNEYRPYDKRAEVKQIASEIKNHRKKTAVTLSVPKMRILDRDNFKKKLDRKEKVEAKGKNTILFSRHMIDLSAIEQLADTSQTRTIALIIKHLTKGSSKDSTIMEAIDEIYTEINHSGLEFLSPFKGQHPGDLALPRKEEVIQTLNRFRRD
ncbi:ABC-ATPase domain-containing protein [Alteribacter keqinensis]|uniref:ATPase n=1 Tax=Alteribacter keqinensis TaxID=2483800 RepID=A0A3M7TYB2_9BACI|nr:ABC-ATPase domain-containing protein [Alteribacter keqinensis]RNA70588.1 ATPase [Alteribacter keqinensis]